MCACVIVSFLIANSIYLLMIHTFCVMYGACTNGIYLLAGMRTRGTADGDDRGRGTGDGETGGRGRGRRGRGRGRGVGRDAGANEALIGCQTRSRAQPSEGPQPSERAQPSAATTWRPSDPSVTE